MKVAIDETGPKNGPKKPCAEAVKIIDVETADAYALATTVLDISTHE